MKKPLHNDEIFFSLVNGKISAIGSDEAWAMVHASNQSLKRSSSGRIVVLDESLAFEDCVLWWLERIVNKEPIGQLTPYHIKQLLRRFSKLSLMTVVFKII